MYRPGELDQRIAFKSESVSSDGMGGQTYTLATIATVWAKIRPLTGNESARFDLVNAEQTAMFICRYRNDINENDRITYDGDDWNIRYITRRGARVKYLEVVAERGVAQ